MKALVAGIVALCGVVVLLAASQVEGQEKGKYTTKEVMKKAMAGKNALVNKVASGDATPAEQDQLIELFESLHKNAPQKGEASAWQKRTEALLSAARNAKKGPQEAMLVKKLADCKGCHSEHKGK